MKRIAILGSTGSIGRNALEVVRSFPGKFKVVALSANSNIKLFKEQIDEFRPIYCGISEVAAAVELSRKLPRGVRLFSGAEGIEELAGINGIDELLLAITGSAALKPLLRALGNVRQVALANKEALVMAGPMIMAMAKQKKAQIIPIDSEQSAIWQCLEGNNADRLENIYLTASGGPFWDVAKEKLRNITIERVLKHPRWKMGRKITVDSATLMNKGLEFLEAMFLFGAPYEKIKVIIHPEALVHSMVEFSDGVVIAQLSATDMRIPIQYALTYPQRMENDLPRIDFYKLKGLHFAPPDLDKFPCLRLAMQAALKLGTLPAVLNASNEVGVEEFLNNRIKFMQIPQVVEKVMIRHNNIKEPGLKDILSADAWAKEEARSIIGRYN